MVGFDGGMNTGLTLRTVRIKNGVAEVRAGATLLYDSSPPAEELETFPVSFSTSDITGGCKGAPETKLPRSELSRSESLLYTTSPVSVSIVAWEVRNMSTDDATVSEALPFEFMSLRISVSVVVAVSIEVPSENMDVCVS